MSTTTSPNPPTTEVIAWLDSDEGQEWLNEHHEKYQWNKGVFADFKKCDPDTVRKKGSVCMGFANPMSDEEIDKFMREGSYRDAKGRFVQTEIFGDEFE